MPPLVLPDLPALADASGELERLKALVAERTAAAAAAESAALEAPAVDRAERVAAIREKRKAAPPTAPGCRGGNRHSPGQRVLARAACTI